MGEVLDFTQELEKESPIKINPDFKNLLKPLTEHAFERFCCKKLLVAKISL